MNEYHQNDAFLIKFLIRKPFDGIFFGDQISYYYLDK